MESDAFRALHHSSGFNPVNMDRINKYSPSEAHLGKHRTNAAAHHADKANPPSSEA
jgi:hypothetical protein